MREGRGELSLSYSFSAGPAEDMGQWGIYPHLLWTDTRAIFQLERVFFRKYLWCLALSDPQTLVQNPCSQTSYFIFFCLFFGKSIHIIFSTNYMFVLFLNNNQKAVHIQKVNRIIQKCFFEKGRWQWFCTKVWVPDMHYVTNAILWKKTLSLADTFSLFQSGGCPHLI